MPEVRLCMWRGRRGQRGLLSNARMLDKSQGDRQEPSAPPRRYRSGRSIVSGRTGATSPTLTITAITFNKRAQEELAERLTGALAPLDIEPRAIRVRTFHALGREILRAAGRTADADHASVLSALGTGSRAYATSSSRPMLRPSSLARACSLGPSNGRASSTGSPRWPNTSDSSPPISSL